MDHPVLMMLKARLYPLINQSPVAKLIRFTAKQQWKVLLVSIFSSVLDSVSEGATLGLLFLAVEIMSTQESTAVIWTKFPFVNGLPYFSSWLSTISPSFLFLLLLALTLIVQALQGCSRFVNFVSVAYLSARIRTLVTSKLHSQILRFTFPCSSGYKIGDLVDYAATGPEAVKIQIEQTSALLVLIPQCITYTIVLLVISPWMLVAVVIIGFVIYQLQRFMIPRIQSGSQLVNSDQVAVNERITEDFQGLRLLHSSGQLEYAINRLSNLLNRLEAQNKRHAPRLGLLAPVSSFLPILAVTLIAGSSVFILGSKGSGVLPSLVTFVLALQRLTIRISMIGSVSNTFADNTGRLKRLNYILSSQDKDFRRIGGRAFDKICSNIAFKKVSLSYGNGEGFALKDISFSFDKGSTLALVGPSGAGKSSIVDVLTGLYPPTSGTVEIDGFSLYDFELSSWQQKLGVVSQDTFLFNASIADNISFGLSDCSHDRVVHACRLAQACQFIESLPNSYSTIVGERGYRLSGGQRQRLSLARALIRNPQLLILDEATSALDSQNEMLVQESIQNLTNKYSIIIIAHRLSTIINAQQILVLDRGRIIQAGIHDNLFAVEGLYRDLWLMQSRSSFSSSN